ncbi:MAG: peptidoglycan-binding protein [Xanthomonadales bacterium]|nr:peptidoglycan-binding protein [Xanthomonadales bacterium]
MPKVEAVRTNATVDQVRKALSISWVALFGEHPSPESICVLLAQWALETGRGNSMWNYNLGNVKSHQKDGDWCFFRCNEVINGKVVWFEPDHPACCFRAYPTLQQGADAYMHELHGRFAKAWPAVISGNPTEFSKRLKASKYYTADEGKYTSTLVSLYREFLRSVSTKYDLFSVLGVQQALDALGYEPGALDGLAGPKTTAAITAFQRDNGLTADGIVGRLTRAELADELSRNETVNARGVITR